MSVARARHEVVNHRFNSCGALQQIWLHNRHKHDTIFKADTTITQLEIENGRLPFQIDGYKDYKLPILL